MTCQLLYKDDGMKKLLLILTMNAYLVFAFGCSASQPQKAAASHEFQQSDYQTAEEKYKVLAEKIAFKKTLGENDLKDLFVIENTTADLNKDGKKEKIYFAAIPLPGAPGYFWQPAYLIYSDRLKNNIFKKLNLNFPSNDLTKKDIKIRYGDLDGDTIPEIFYSVDIPLPEYSVSAPHFLQYDNKVREFKDIDISTTYNYYIVHWDLKQNDKDSSTVVWMDIKKNFADNNPVRRNFKLIKGRLVKYN